MTRKDIIHRTEVLRMAREAGDTDRIDPFTKDGDWVILTPDELERFANLVASAAQAKERKECEKIIWNADAWIGSDAKIWLVKSIQEARGQA